MYYTEDKPSYNDKEANKLSYCAIAIMVGFLLLIASLAGWFSVVHLGDK